MTSVAPPLGTVTDRWELDRLDTDLYRAWCMEGSPLRAFGGQVAAQALAAAATEVAAARPVNSLHAYFVRPGDTRKAIVYRVERTREGRSFSTRRVTALQDGAAILVLQASFHVPEEGIDHAPGSPVIGGPDAHPLGDPPARGGTSDARAIQTAEAQWLQEQSEKFRFELRFQESPTTLVARRGEVADGQRFWLRSRDPLPATAMAHACALTYASDMYLLSTALAVHGLSVRNGGYRASSLDHAIWFHRPCRVDDWLLYEQSSPTSAAGRTYSTGRVFDHDGLLIASVAQEGLVRRSDARSDTTHQARTVNSSNGDR
jgi:acyl-CoA thioesterase-2